MANERNCVFCGEKLGPFQLRDIRCGETLQMCCKACAGEAAKLSETERCKRALQLGFALEREKLEAWIAKGEQAEKRRPICPHCGTGLRFMPHQYLDNSPVGSGRFTVIPAYCQTCGNCQLYLPDIVEKDELLNFLIQSDTNG